MSYAGNKGFEYFDCLDNPSFYFDLYDLIVFCKATAWWSECDYYFFIQGQIFESNGNEMQISTPTVPFPYQLFSQILSSKTIFGRLGLEFPA